MLLHYAITWTRIVSIACSDVITFTRQTFATSIRATAGIHFVVDGRTRLLLPTLNTAEQFERLVALLFPLPSITIRPIIIHRSREVALSFLREQSLRIELPAEFARRLIVEEISHRGQVAHST